MNRKQLICMWCGIGIIALMGLFPPVRKPKPDSAIRIATRLNYSGGDIREKAKPFPYGFFLAWESSRIEFNKLLVQWAIVAFVTGGLVYTFKDKMPKDE